MLMSTNKFTGKNVHDYTTYQVGLIESSAHRALRQYKDKILKPYGITGIEWYIIGNIKDMGRKGIRVTDLANKFGTTVGFMTKTVNLLEAKNILKRFANAQDARSTYIMVAPKYLKTIEQIEKDLRLELKKTLYQKIKPQDLSNYISVLEQIVKL